MEASNTDITDLPLEIHHEIGSYLSAKQLKAVSLVSWQFFDSYSYPLSKKTVTKLEKLLKKTKKGFINKEVPPLRKQLCNLRMKASMVESLGNLDIDRESVRDVQVMLDKEFSENLFILFPKLQSLRFFKGEEEFDLNSSQKILVLPRNLKLVQEAISSFQNFQQIICEIDEVENMNNILENNIKSLRGLTIRGTFEQEILEKTLPENLILQTLTIQSEGKNLNTSFSHLKAFEKSENFKLEMNFKNYFSDYFVNLFPFLTHLSLMFNEQFSSHLVFTPEVLQKKWYLPKLRVFKTNYCGEQYIENIEAPNMEKLELENMYNTYTLECLKRFQGVTEIQVGSHKASFLKNAIEFFTQNFKNLRVLKIQQEGVLDVFQINVVLHTIEKFQLTPISQDFKNLRVFGTYSKEDDDKDLENLEHYQMDSYPHVKKWSRKMGPYEIEIVFHIIRRKLGEFNFNLFE